MSRYLRSLSLVVLALLPAACRIEDQFIFHPSATIEQTPQRVGLDFEDLFFSTRDGLRLNGWLVPHHQARSTLVWFHGNAGNISHRVENIKLLHDKVKVNIFIFDYRGYGRSEGRASEEGTYLDGQAAIDCLRTRYSVETKNLVLFGRSLGAAVASELANRIHALALIL